MVDYLSVSRLTQYLKLKFDRDPYLERVYVTGQVSNFRKRPKHQYFSLKDDKSVLQVTMWSGVYQHLGFELEEGMQVNAVGRVQLYEPSGSYSIVVEKMEPDGIGALAVQFEQLKSKLTTEGLFRQELKQELPRFSKKIGVITSPSGAVIQDIITTVSRRFSGTEIVLYPTRVQGDGAAAEIADRIRQANERTDIDVLIVGRGGGSIEDLWAFNEEVVVRAIVASRLPIISSVGHETDTTLADFSADRRAATPTAAAELATPITKADLLGHLQQQKNRAYQALQHQLQHHRSRLERTRQSVLFRQPERLYERYMEQVDRLTMSLQTGVKSTYREQYQAAELLRQRLQGVGMSNRIGRYQRELSQQYRLLKSHMATVYDGKVARADKLIDALASLDTRRIVTRGYAILEQDGRIIDSVKTVQSGKNLTIRMRDGQVEVEVKDVKESNI